MKRSLWIIAIVVALLTGCKKDSDAISANASNPAFVIDAMKVTATEKTDPISGAPATFLSLNVTYHFDGKAGSLDGLSLSTDEVSFIGIFEPFQPTPINSPEKINQEFKAQRTFAGQESIFVRVGFGGRFWEADHHSENMIPFTFKDSMWVPLQH